MYSNDTHVLVYLYNNYVTNNIIIINVGFDKRFLSSTNNYFTLLFFFCH